MRYASAVPLNPSTRSLLISQEMSVFRGPERQLWLQSSDPSTLGPSRVSLIPHYSSFWPGYVVWSLIKSLAFLV